MSEKQEVRNLYEELRAPFPLNNYSVDSSRGFDLTSLRAQYIPIRLNEVLGLSGWSFDGAFQLVGSAEKPTGVIYSGKLWLNLGHNEKGEPQQKLINGIGFSSMKKNVGDSYKSAMTDALSKCASYSGIAEQAFCGLVDPNDVKKANGTKTVGKTKAEPKVGAAKKTFKKPAAAGTDSGNGAW